MARYSEQFLDDIRKRITLSELIGRSVSLKKQGREYVAVDNPSLSVNDSKGIWKDFGGANEGGDCFAWLVKHEGKTFSEAVAICAGMAGVRMEGEGRASAAGGRRGKASPRRAAAADAPEREEPPPHTENPSEGSPAPAPAAAAAPRRQLVATYDYQDGNEVTVYQVCRWEWMEKGKRRKTFSQRRPSPDEPGVWIWSLDAGEFIRPGPGKDWTPYDDAKLVRWGEAAEQRTFDDAAAHTLYRLPKIMPEVAAGEDGQTVFLVEGEKDVHTIEGWGLLGTTNSGGAKHWSQYHAELLRGADVVIIGDNDDAGREGALKKARALRGVARRLRVLDMAELWPGCPEKGDITDWAKANGNADKLFAFVDKLPDWKPILKVSKFGRISWSNMLTETAPPYRWLVKGLIPEGESVLIYGDSQTGKSFFTYDLAMHIARGMAFRGRRTDQGLVVYCAMEAGRGFRQRMRAYLLSHQIRADEEIPFEVLTKKADLFSGEIDTDDLIKEIEAIAEERDMPVAAVVIDTYNAATPGMKEIASEDVSLTNQRLDRIREKFRCGVWIVHHKNAQGDRPRGHTSLYAGIETAIEVRMVREGKTEVKDADGRPIREAWVHKQREGLDRWDWRFVLPAVEIGYDEDGERITSCVVAQPGGAEYQTETAAEGRAEPAKYGLKLNAGETSFVRALLRALDAHGISPATANVPLINVQRVVDYKHLRELYGRANIQEDEEPGKARERLKQALRRARIKLDQFGIIGQDNPYMWLSGKPFTMADGKKYPPPKDEAQPKDEETGADAPPVDPDDFFG